MIDRKKILAVDIDLTLAEYKSPWTHDLIGKPISEIVRSVQLAKDEGFFIIIYTGRLETPVLEKWLQDNKIPYDAINRPILSFPWSSKSKIYYFCIWDDKAVNPINIKEKRYKTAEEMLEETKALTELREEWKK